MNPVVIIPTYISSRRRKEAGPVLATYDHTTPVSQPGELPRCLQSLRCVRGLGQVIVLVISEPGIENQATSKIRRLALQYPDLNVLVIGAPEANLVSQRCEQLGINARKEIALSGYSASKNFGLLLADVLGFDAAVFVDDDEVIEDPAFLEKAMYGLGKMTRRGVPILAKSGFFLDKDGSFLAEGKSAWYNRFWDQASAYNQQMAISMKGPRLSRSNCVCGGCMAIHREAFKRVSFDPYISRGEDLDYMINLRMYGSEIWFDNKWSLRHLPPEGLPEGLRFRQDIFRWLYEFRKIEYGRTQIDLLPIKPQSMQPYPGPFLEGGLLKRIKRTALLRAIGTSDGAGYRQAAKSAASDASLYAESNCKKYFEFQFKWPTIMARVEGDSTLANALVQSALTDQAQAQRVRESIAASGFDPGSTGEIRLNMGSED